MLKLASKTRGSVEESAPVSLLDWYDLDQELILVLERPVPCKDLSHYIKANGGSLKEEEAKVSCSNAAISTRSVWFQCSPPSLDYFYHRCVFAKFKLHSTSVPPS